MKFVLVFLYSSLERNVMALSFPTNVRFNIYRTPDGPGDTPAASNVAGVMRPDFQRGQESGDRSALGVWTHILLVDVTVDIRDAYAGGGSQVQQDSIWLLPNQDTRFTVTFVERVARDTAGEHLRVYLDRQDPSWPTLEV